MVASVKKVKAPKKLPADDLFEKSSMTFGEHLEELRKALIKAFMWLGVGVAIGLVFASSIVDYMEKPLREAILDFHVRQAKAEYKRVNGHEPSDAIARWILTNKLIPEHVFVDPHSFAKPDDEPETKGNGRISAASPADAGLATSDQADTKDAGAESLSDENSANAEENPANGEDDSPTGSSEEGGTNSTRPVDGGDPPKNDSAIPSEPARPIIAVDSSPWKGVDADTLSRLRPFILWRPVPSKLVSLTPVEGFMIWLKAGFVAGIVIASPGMFYHIWQFFAAGLYPHERRYVYWYLPLSLALFLAGVCLAFFLVFRLVLSFLMTYTTELNVEFTPRLNDYMSFALFLPLGFGLAFQLPIAMLGLHRFGVVTVDAFIKHWRVAVMAIAFLSMIFTPADIYSMLGLFIPLSALYFLGILLCLYMPRGAGWGAPAEDPRG